MDEDVVEDVMLQLPEGAFGVRRFPFELGAKYPGIGRPKSSTECPLYVDGAVPVDDDDE